MTVDNKIHNGRENMEKEENLQKTETGQKKKEGSTVALV